MKSQTLPISLAALAFLVATGTFAGLARASATPVTPPPGAMVTTSNPLFTWTLPSNEQSDGVSVANKPDTTAEGKFYAENVVDGSAFASDERQWLPNYPLFAGTYWWLVLSHDRETSRSYYSAPAAFTIPPTLELRPLKAQRFLGLHQLYVVVHWKANVRHLTAHARLVRGGKIIWKRRQGHFSSISMPGTNEAIFSWYRPRQMKLGTRLTCRVWLFADGLQRARTIVVRAP